jgi:hypothetical protein
VVARRRDGKHVRYRGLVRPRVLERARARGTARRLT